MHTRRAEPALPPPSATAPPAAAVWPTPSESPSTDDQKSLAYVRRLNALPEGEADSPPVRRVRSTGPDP